MIPFAAYTAAETPIAFQWVDNPKISPHNYMRIWNLSNTWFFGPTEKTPKTASRTVQPFYRLTNMTNRQTDRQTDMSDRKTMLLRL